MREGNPRTGVQGTIFSEVRPSKTMQQRWWRRRPRIVAFGITNCREVWANSAQDMQEEFKARRGMKSLRRKVWRWGGRRKRLVAE